MEEAFVDAEVSQVAEHLGSQHCRVGLLDVGRQDDDVPAHAAVMLDGLDGGEQGVCLAVLAEESV